MTRSSPARPEMSPACSEALPSVGDTVCTVRRSSFTGRAPKVNWVANVLAWSSVKLPEIWTLPLNEVKLDWPGRVIGAEMTWPSRSMPMMAWNCWLVSVSHCLAPSDVRLRLTDQTPVFNWAFADFTAVPVIPAGPRTYRAVNPLALVPGSSTVAFFSSLVDGVGG